MNEGLAEYYSTFELAQRRPRFMFGRPIAAHIFELSSETWMPVGALVSTTHDSPQYNENSRRGVFYAESWLLVHMLQLGKPDRLPHSWPTRKELSNGTAADAAWHHQFDDNEIYKSLRAYSRQNRSVAPLHAVGSNRSLPASPCRSLPPASTPRSASCRWRWGVPKWRGSDSIGRCLRSRDRCGADRQGGRRRRGTTYGGGACGVGRLVRRLHDGGHAGGAVGVDRSLVARGCTAGSLTRGGRPRGHPEPAGPVCEGQRADQRRRRVGARRAGQSTRGGSRARRLHDAPGARAGAGWRLSGCAIDVGGADGTSAFSRQPGRCAAADADRSSTGRRRCAGRRAASAGGRVSGRRRSRHQVTVFDQTLGCRALRPVYRDVGVGEQRVEGTLERIECSAARTEFVVRAGDRLARFPGREGGPRSISSATAASCRAKWPAARGRRRIRST